MEKVLRYKYLKIQIIFGNVFKLIQSTNPKTILIISFQTIVKQISINQISLSRISIHHISIKQIKVIQVTRLWQRIINIFLMSTITWRTSITMKLSTKMKHVWDISDQSLGFHGFLGIEWPLFL